MTLTPKVRQIAFGVYVAIRNSGDAYRKAKVRNSGIQGSPLTWARLADISGENPDGARFGGSCRRTIDFD